MSSKDNPAQNIKWDLTDLYDSLDSENFKEDKKRVVKEAEEFSETYKDRIDELDPQELLGAVKEYEQIVQLNARLYSFVYLKWSCDTQSEELGAKLQEITELKSEVEQALTFFTVEWRNLDDDTAQKFLEDEALSEYHHYLEVSREYEPHTLSNKEEQIISAKDVTGTEAWSRFFDQQVNGMQFEVNGEMVTQDEIRKLRQDPDREIREAAHDGFTEGLKEKIDIFSFVFNTVLADKATEDELRDYSSWLESRNLANEIEQNNVDALVNTVVDNYDLVQRFYKLKREVLGYEGFYEHDMNAPLFDIDRNYSWEEGKKEVLDAYYGFDEKMGSTVEKFFENNWIDGQIKPEKRSGAFSAPTTADVHPYVLVNYSGDLRSIQILAHELGHGVHQYLSGKNQNFLEMNTPLTTAETASVFGEMLTFENLYQSLEDDKEKLYLLGKKIDDIINTVFRQISMNRFEESIHKARRNQGELSVQHFNKLWRECQKDLCGDAVELTEDYNFWWCYIPHFVQVPGYVYAYAFGQLLVLALYDKYKHSDGDFSDGYLEVLEAGGSDWPEEIVGKLDMDITDPEFWQYGIEIIEDMIKEAEDLAEEID